MLLVPDPEGVVVVSQPDHGRMCAQLGRAWGNELVGEVTPREEVIRAAEVHDDGWLEWERSPVLDRATGRPYTFATAPYTVHLSIHLRWARELAAREPYPGLLVSLHHASFFPRPRRRGRLGPGGRRIGAFRDELDESAARTRELIDASDEEIDRNRRLVRTWDGVSHDLLVNALPRTRPGVPAAGRSSIDLTVSRVADRHVVAPWPFASDELLVTVPGRHLSPTFTDERALREALAQAPPVELRYVLRPD